MDFPIFEIQYSFSFLIFVLLLFDEDMKDMTALQRVQPGRITVLLFLLEFWSQRPFGAIT